MDESGIPYRMLIMPDHPTPVRLRTHVSDPIPYMLYDSTAPQRHSWHYNEREAAMSGNREDEGYKMIDHLFSR
jgi:2,3-bisphosphoglycerate-independent phosphoglycerate mutase